MLSNVDVLTACPFSRTSNQTMKSFTDKTAVITGAGSGIGRAIAAQLANQGAEVHCIDVRKDRLDAFTGEAAEYLGRVLTHTADVSDVEQTESTAAKVGAQADSVDILVCNAGICVSGAMEDLTEEDWNKVVSINLFGTVNYIRAFLPAMIRKGNGHIVIVASLAGLMPFPFVAPYTATKYALVGLGESLAIELRRYGVRVSVMCPGAVATSLYSDGIFRLPQKARTWIETNVNKTAPSPELIARDVIKALRSQKTLVVRAGFLRPLWFLSRLVPRIFLCLAKVGFHRLMLRVDRRLST